MCVFWSGATWGSDTEKGLKFSIFCFRGGQGSGLLLFVDVMAFPRI